VPKYVLEDGELVSVEWKTAIVHAGLQGNNVNEGHRTMARQQYFYNCYLCKCCNNGNLAARPSPFAPHIRTGRTDHAIDFADGSDAVRKLETVGIDAGLPVRGEGWHVEADASDLRAFHKKKGRPKWMTLPRHIRRRVKKFIAARNTVRNRIEDRDKINSKTNPRQWEEKDALVKKWVRIRNRRRKRLERLLKRARRARTRRILRELLDHPKSN
jgi:hypothetical protein